MNKRQKKLFTKLPGDCWFVMRFAFDNRIICFKLSINKTIYYRLKSSIDNILLGFSLKRIFFFHIRIAHCRRNWFFVISWVYSFDILRVVCYIDFKCCNINFQKQRKQLTQYPHLASTPFREEYDFQKWVYMVGWKVFCFNGMDKFLVGCIYFCYRHFYFLNYYHGCSIAKVSKSIWSFIL